MQFFGARGWVRRFLLSLTAGFCIFGLYLFFPRRQCSMNVFIDSVVDSIESRGDDESLIDDVFFEPCWGIENSEKAAIMFDRSIRNLLQSCMKTSSPRKMRTSTKKILTLLTTWVSSPDKYLLHNITMRNWRNISSEINLILFTNDTSLGLLAANSGWTVLPIRHHNAKGIPIFKSLFEDSIIRFQSSFYAYANSDILFDESLIDTLHFIESEMNLSEPILLTGRRINVQDITVLEAHPLANLRKTVQKRGELFQVDAQDVFIVNSEYDWKSLPDLVIGRPAYDNWVVAHSICSGLTVVDITKTILMAHQTTHGNAEGFSYVDKYYNRELVKKMGRPTYYKSGFTNCIELRTYRNYCGEYKIGKREFVNIPESCSCEYWV